MDFLSLHEKITEHQNLSLFLLSKFKYKKTELKKNMEYRVKENEFIIVLNGLSIKKINNRITGEYQYSFNSEGDFIFMVEDDETYYLSNIKKCHIAILNKDAIFDTLEEDGLLVHLFLEQYLKVEEEMHFLNLQLLNSNKRIIHYILQISRLNQQAFKLPYLLFPKEITVTSLAKYCNCNRITASRLLSKLKEKKYIFPEEEGFMIPEENVEYLLNM
ncbi:MULTISPECIES: Crp/Fnr family transcriptional regulator [Listeria]|uniref:Crp/Fnr family transcriptional regulator n=1 Tax=Listeria TaxID=1637 RepID=UPI000B59368D|nr:MULTISPECIES: Crp/Fnr family transcriptional regulator [Listeria]